MPNPRYKPVTVTWTDAGSYGGWKTQEDGLPGDLVITTRGYLIRKEPRRLIVAQSVSTSGHYADIIVIPRPWVIK